jgi:hypothetical protein
MWKKVELLKYHANFQPYLAYLFALCWDLDAINDQLPGTNHFQAVNTANQCGFSRARGADNHNNFSLVDG